MSIFDLDAGEGVSEVKVGEKVFFIKHLNALERDKFEQQWLKVKPDDSVIGIRAFAAVFCLCSKDGKLSHPSGGKVTPNKEFLEAVEHANKTPAGMLSKLSDVALEVNGFSKSDVDELEKN